mgnify:FL=1|tara:strand:- start:3320 stop:3715 length:396 start_codon:yes stop_codon:yes gene_type:complete
MGYSKKWDFHYTDRKDYEYKYHKALRKTAKGRELVKKSNRLTTRKRYNLTNEQFDKLWEEAWCHICGITQEELNIKHKNKGTNQQSLNIDHCHKTGKIGKLLCNDCNVMLGRAKDSVEILIEAIKYIRRER